MNALLKKIRSTFLPQQDVKKQLNQQVEHENPAIKLHRLNEFPKGYHVFGITSGPENQIMVGAGNPATAEGCIFLQQNNGSWRTVHLPDETAWVSQFIRTGDSYVASGMNAIGRAAIIRGNGEADEWTSVSMDLHPYSTINALVQLSNGEILAATGEMITQGKTRPVLLRSRDSGITWEKEEQKLPITQFHTLYIDGNRIYGGTSGDHNPSLYCSDDFGKTWVELAKLPSYKTYKTIALQPIEVQGERRLLALMWGYKLDIADRVVRLYLSDDEQTTWEEMPPILDSHFIFSFLVTDDYIFYAGSEKGKFLRSVDFGQSWEILAKFPTNIGAFTIFNQGDDIWLGKDFVEPSHQSLWKVSE